MRPPRPRLWRTSPQCGESGTPAIVKVWRAHWAEFTPFLAFPPEVRRVIYTANLIESMNARLRKVTRNRG
jgi:putative transposase